MDAGSEQLPPSLAVITLGRLDIRWAGQPASGLKMRKTQALLVYLAVNPGRHDRGRLIGLLWGEQPEEQAQRNLRHALWELRQALAPAVLASDRLAVGLNPRVPCQVDALTFEAELEQAGDPAAAIRHLEAAIALYQGEFLAQFDLSDCPEFAEWAARRQAGLQERALDALGRLAAYYTQRGEYDRALGHARRQLALAPWWEEAHRRVMTLLALTGQRSAALAQYEECRRLLAEELGLEPLEETTALYERIRDGEMGGRGDAEAHRVTASPHLPFVGRETEHATLVAWWERARQGEGRLALVEGEAGVGKTRLVEEAARYIEAHGAVVLRGRCYEFGGDVPYQPIAEALRGYLHDQETRRGRDAEKSPCLPLTPSPPPPLSLSPVWLMELARLLPEVRESRPDLPAAPPVTGEAARQRLFEALARFLLGFGPWGLVVFLDDLHWADQSTLDLLHYLVRRLAAAPIWFVGTYRPEEAPLSHPLTRLRQGLSRDQRVDRLTLEPLTAEAVGEIAGVLVNAETRAACGQALYRESEGNPFILTETVRDWQERGLLREGAAGRWQWAGPAAAAALPAGVQNVVLQRVGRLSAPAQRLLTLAAVIGRQFDAALLRAAAGPDAPAVDDSLDEWLTRRLVSPRSSVHSPQPRTGAATENWRLATWDFAHDKIRAVVYHAAGAARQQSLHRRIGQALEELYAGQPAAVCEQLAYHYERAGEVELALTYLPLAAARAAAVYAHQEAVGYYDRALALLGPADPRRWGVLLQRGQALHFLSRYDEAMAACRQVVEGAAGALVAQAANELSALYRARRDYTEARAWGERAARWAEASQAAAERARAQQMQAEVAREQGDLARAQELFAAALAHYQAVDDPRGRAECLSGLGRVFTTWGRYAEAQQQFEAALPAFQALGDRPGEAACQRAIGVIWWRQHAYDAARQALTASLNLCRAIGDPEGEAQSLNDLALAYFSQGDQAEAQHNWEESAALFRALGLEKRVASCLHRLGILHMGQGNYAVAQRYLEESLAINRTAGSRLSEALDQGWLGKLHLLRGAYDQARACCEAALALEREVGGSEEEIWHLGSLGAVAYELGDPAQARSFFEAANQQIQARGSPLGIWHRCYVAACLAQGDGPAAGRIAQQALAWMQQAAAETIRTEEALGACRTLLGIVHGSGLLAEAEDPLPHFERAIGALRVGDPFEYGVTLRCYGAYLARHGCLEQGQAHLREAQGVFERIGAQGELAKVLRLLAGDADPGLQW